MLKPIRTEKLYNLIIEQIGNLIDEEELKPGDRLPPEREIAASLSVSRSSVRQAITTLVAKGLLTVQQGGGTYVAEPNEQPEIKHSLLEELCWNLAEQQISPTEISESRLLIECETARLCAIRADEATCKALEDLLDRKRLARGDKATYDELNRDLHTAIAEGSGNMVLKILMDNILQLMRSNMWPWAKNKTSKREEVLQKHLDQHEELVDAIIHHDPERARQVMYEHLSVIGDEMSLLFNQDETKKY